jgi:hypothetical protein
MSPMSRSADSIARAGIILTATGVVSAATVRHAIDEGGDLVLAYAFVIYLVLILLAVPRRQHRYAPLVAFFAFVAMYLSAAADPEADWIGLALYVAAATFAYLVTPRLYRPLTVAAFALWTPAIRFFGPDPTFGEYRIGIAIATVLGLFFLVAVLVDREVTDVEERIRRIGLGLLAVACVARITERHDLVAVRGIIAPDDVWALIVVAVLALLAVVPLHRLTRDALATGAALGAYVLVAAIVIVGKHYHVDAVALVHRATDLFLAGQDPYRELRADETLRYFGLDPALQTHLENGSGLQTFNYPALSFLVPAPFVALGLADLRALYLAEIVGLVLVLVRQARIPWRPLVTAAVVGNSVIWRQNVVAGADPLWAVLAIFSFVFLRSRWASPILLGLACATRQPAWFFVPFYLLLIWKREGGRSAARRAGIVAVAAILPNLPFFLWSPDDFIEGVGAPMLGALQPYGVGLIRFGVDGVLPLLPRGVYGALSLVAMAGLLIVLWRNWRRIPLSALVFPSVVLWFAWRSLQNYFGFAGILALSGDESLLGGEGEGTADDVTGSPVRT